VQVLNKSQLYTYFFSVNSLPTYKSSLNSLKKLVDYYQKPKNVCNKKLASQSMI